MRCYFNFAILILIISVIRVYPFEITCPFCIDSLVDFESKDDFYKRSMESVIYSFNDCLEELKLKNTTVPGGPSCSLVICYHTVEETKEYRKKGHIYWLHSLIDTGMSYSSDHYKFRYTKSNCLFEDEYISKEFQKLVM